MELSIISVTYNDANVIQGFLQSLLKSEVCDGSLDSEVFVVDNASRDETVQIIKEQDHFVRLTELEENVGFSRANNKALAQSRGRYVCFLNPDTKFSKGVFKALISYLEENQEVGAVTPKVLLPDGSLDLNTRRNFPTPMSALMHFFGVAGSGYYISGKEDEIQEVPACGGAFLLVKREVLQKVGDWDEDFFLYGEDLDLCYRIREEGWKITYVPTVSILHYGGVSTGIKESGASLSTADKSQRVRMAEYSVEAMALFYKKHLARQHTFLVNLLVGLGFRGLKFLRLLQYS